jgi:metal-sulfur cluster biosynthetic enzyme
MFGFSLPVDYLHEGRERDCHRFEENFLMIGHDMEQNNQISQQQTTETEVFQALKEVYDPEIPVSIVDLGLIYEVKIIDDWVGVKMTLTTPGCGMGGSIANLVRTRILDLPGVHECDVRLVWEPMWTPAMMSDEAKKKLGVT